jgi:hypothetical protein
LITAGCSIVQDESALILSVRFGYTYIVKLLIKECKSLDIGGKSPLSNNIFNKCVSGESERNTGTYIDQVDRDGRTALIWAVVKGH